MREGAAAGGAPRRGSGEHAGKGGIPRLRGGAGASLRSTPSGIHGGAASGQPRRALGLP